MCNTNVCIDDRRLDDDGVRAMFDEQVGWAAEAGVDFVIGETFQFVGEALAALEVIRDGRPAVGDHARRSTRTRRPARAGPWPRRAAGCRTPARPSSGSTASAARETMLPLLAAIVDAVDVPVAALPVPYRTHAAEPTFQSLTDPTVRRCPTAARSRSRWTR